MDIQKEIKPWPLAGYAPGNYMNTCAYCKKQMEKVDKLCFMCLECALIETHKYISHLEKDRGVEKAAEESTSENFNTTDLKTNPYYKGFIAGAKWAGNDAVEFAEWIDETYTRVHSYELNKSAWINCKDVDVMVNGSDYHFTTLINNFGKTTEQLYNLFKQKQL